MTRAVAAWRATYEQALSVAAGDALTVGPGDGEWPGWVWCEDASGLGGWLPEGVVHEGRAATDFDTRELSVTPGDRVAVTDRRAGWAWCLADDGRAGWVPERCLSDR